MLSSRSNASRPVSTRLYARFNAIAWDLRYALLGRHFAVPSDVMIEIGRPSALLDVGCGRGNLLRMLRARGWNGTYCGIDVSRYALAQARKIRDHNAIFRVESLENFNAGEWDCIVIAETIYYVDLAEVQRQIGKYRSLLNPGGKLLIRIHDFRKFRRYVVEVCSTGAEPASSALLIVNK